jgi:hypothetical protein
MKYTVTERIEREISIDAPKFYKRDYHLYAVYKAVIPHDEEVTIISISTSGQTKSFFLSKRTDKFIDHETTQIMTSEEFHEITEPEFRRGVSEIASGLTDKLTEKL